MQKTLKNRTVFCRDNLEALRGINSGTIDLIYLDPPFNKKKEFTAPIGSDAEGASFHDYFREGDIKEEWLGLIADEYPILHDYIQGIGSIGHKSNKYYLCYMAVRLIELHRILKDVGSIYLHCDPTMSHYLKLLMDCIFGADNFKNEIVWHYRTYQGKVENYYPNKHDLILAYVKDENKSVLINSLDYMNNYKDTVDYERWKKYFVNGNQIKYSNYPATDSRFTAYLNRWIKDNGRTPNEEDVIYECNGYVIDDVWADLQAIDPKDKKERVGYPTQKPLALLKRVIEGSTNKGDVVLDPFCGCATTCVAAEKSGRKWVGIDISKKAFDLVQMRLSKEIEERDPLFFRNKIIYREDIPTRTDDVKPKKLNNKHYLFGLQEGKCKACSTRFDYRHFHIDHIIPKSKGGGDNIENLQLLCGSCNTIKGNRDMNYLMKRLRELGAIH